MHYLRFTIPGDRTALGDDRGVVGAAYALRSHPDPDPKVRVELERLLAWLDRNLTSPHRWSRSKRWGAYRGGLCWIKSSANEHVRVLRRIGAMLTQHGHPVQEHVAERPGYIVYEDAHQVVAEPFRGQR